MNNMHKRHRKYLTSCYCVVRTGKKNLSHRPSRPEAFRWIPRLGKCWKCQKVRETFAVKYLPLASHRSLRMPTTTQRPYLRAFLSQIALPDYVDARIEALQPIIGYRKLELFPANRQQRLNLRCAIETPLNLLNLICCDSKTPKRMEMKALSQRSSIKMQCCQLS